MTEEKEREVGEGAVAADRGKGLSSPTLYLETIFNGIYQ